MSEFFRGWKRKVGVATLIVACVFAALWVRGQTIKDVYQFGSGEGPFFNTLVSSRFGLMWLRYQATDGTTYSWNPGWFEVPIDATTTLHSGECRLIYDIQWRLTWWGFDFCNSAKGDQIHAVHRNIPYWSIVIPLTLISAWLLLGKPRQARKPPASPVRT